MNADNFLNNSADDFLNQSADGFLDDHHEASWAEAAGKTIGNSLEAMNNAGAAYAAILPHYLGMDKLSDAIFNKAKEGNKLIENATPKAETTIPQDIVTGVANPLAIPAMLAGPVNTGMQMTDTGENLKKAELGSLINTAGTLATAGIGPGNTRIGSMLKSGAVNALQHLVGQSAISAISDNPETQQQQAPTLRSTLVAGAQGMGAGLLMGKKQQQETPPEPTSDKFKALDAQEPVAPDDGLGKNIQGELDLRPPDMPVDENGMPYNPKLSMDVQREYAPEQMDMFEDKQTPPTIPIVDEEGAKRQQMAQMWAEREAQKAMEGQQTAADAHEDSLYALQDELTRNMSFKGQRGAAPMINDLADLVKKGLDKFNDGLRSLDELSLKPLPTAEDYISKNIPGADKNVVATPPTADKAIPDILKANDIPNNVHTDLKSGLELTSSQFGNHPLLGTVARWLQYPILKSDFQAKQIVEPVRRVMNKLPVSDMKDLMELIRRENVEGKRYSDTQLAAAGFSDKLLNTYKMYRDAMDKVFDMQNERQIRAGEDPITKEEAYMSYSRMGDWHLPVFDKDGRLRWYVRANSKGELKQAQAYLKENFPELDFDNLKPKYYSDMLNPNVPKDVMSSYKALVKLFEGDELSGQIQTKLNNVMDSTRGWIYGQRNAMEKNPASAAYNALGQAQHFLEKKGVRGFEGDKPWLSPRDNALAAANAQVKYMENAIRWSNLQDAMGQVKDIINNPDVQDKMPNAVELAKQYANRQAGAMPAMTANIENYIAKSLGVSRSNLYGLTHTLKTAAYLTQLGFSVGYAIATPIQMLINGPAWHMILSQEGYKHSLSKNLMKTFGDGMAGLANHLGYEISGKNVDVPMSPLGKQALEFAENNGIINKNIFDEYHGAVGESPITQGAKKAFGWTISAPDKLGRWPTFISFVHHLDESGMYTDKQEMFDHARRLTDRAVGSFLRSERPLLPDKLGAMGEAAFTYKSFLFNQFNQWAAMAQKGRIAPLAASIFGLAALGGALNLPGVQEADGMWNLFKNMVAKTFPQHYDKISGMGLKSFIIEHLPETLAFGAVSKATGANMTSRFSPGAVDPEHPLDTISPLWQEGREWLSSASAVTDPTKRNLAQAAWQQMPPLGKGMMETNMDVFKGPKQGDKQTYFNPDKLNNPTVTYARDKNQEFYRSVGLTELGESKDRMLNYISRGEGERRQTARDTAMQRLFTGAIDNDPDRVQKFAQVYVKLGGDDGSFNKDFDKAIEKSSLTPEQRNFVHSQSFAAVQDIMRLEQAKKNAGINK